MLIEIYIKELKKGVVVGVNDTLDQYGNNVAVWDKQTTEEIKNKAKKNYIGNGKVVYSKSNVYPTAKDLTVPKQEEQKPITNHSQNEADLPF